MAFEQNPYAVKLSMTADLSLTAASQFLFVKVGPSTGNLTCLASTGSAVITGFNTGSTFPASLVPGSVVTTAQAGLQGAVVTSISPAAGSITLNTVATGTTNALAFNPASSNGGPVASLVTATTDRPLGVLQNQPTIRNAASGTVEALAEAEVTISGITKVVAGGSITAGSAISTNGSGQAVAVSFSATGATGATYAAPLATSFVLGTAITGGASGDIITVAVNCSAAGRAA